MVAICDLERYRCDHRPSGQCIVPDRSAVPSVDSRFSAERCAGFPRRPDETAVDTSTLYSTLNLPVRFEKSYIFKGYGVQVKEACNPLYQTTNSQYGWFTPNVHTVPQRFFPRTNEFSDLLGKCGMYRNYSLNTAMDPTVY